MELDVTPAKARPAVSCAVDPPDEVEVIYILDCSEVRPLKEWLSPTQTHKGADLPILPTRPRRGHHLDPLSRESPSVAICNVRDMSTVVSTWGEHSLPRIDQPWTINRAPAEVLYFRYVRRLLIELAHGCWCEAAKRRTITAAIREHVEEREE
jgi:hypothetical protein